MPRPPRGGSINGSARQTSAGFRRSPPGNPGCRCWRQRFARAGVADGTGRRGRTHAGRPGLNLQGAISKGGVDCCRIAGKARRDPGATMGRWQYAVYPDGSARARADADYSLTPGRGCRSSAGGLSGGGVALWRDLAPTGVVTPLMRLQTQWRRIWLAAHPQRGNPGARIDTVISA